MPVPQDRDKAAQAERYRSIRQVTERICRPLAVDDYQVQAVVDASPPKWHLAHVSWFFETFLLQPFTRAYKPADPRFTVLFNSYYGTVGEFHPRPMRHVLSRPTVEEVYSYRARVDEGVIGLIRDASGEAWRKIAPRITLGLNHEQQHQELLLMDIKRNFSLNPLRPAYAEEKQGAGSSQAAPFRWTEWRGGVREIGHPGDGFCFDNELPRHRVFLEDFRLGSRLVTNGEYLDFVRDDGYGEIRHWLSDGWATVRQEGWRAPLYWTEVDGAWHEMTLHGLRPLRAAEPVCHVSYYEADAYARWRGFRLPTEEELEAATASTRLAGNLLESGLLHPRAARDDGDGQWFGDLWEWTRSAYAPYPGFRPLEGSLGEYKGKFMANQFVLRGGCCATPQSHLRGTYRNFYYPRDRWPFTGIRLAADLR
jgi:ergothioneine biosynthesis protein EgtB